MNNTRTLPSILILYFTALLQGFSFTAIPSAANFLLSQNGFNLFPSQYGMLFVPFALTGILSLFVSNLLGKSFGIKTVFVIGIFFNILSMTTLAFSQTVLAEPKAAYSILLTVMALLGFGLGANIIALYPYVLHYYPNQKTYSILALQTIFAVGSSLSPLLFTFFLNREIWWIYPFLIATAFLILIVASLERIPSSIDILRVKSLDTIFSSSLFWNFIVIGLLYGLIEASFANWSSIFLFHERSVVLASANYALFAFWISFAIGKILFKIFSSMVSPRYIYIALPIILLASLLCIHLTASAPSGSTAFAIAGLGCSALLPLTINFAENHFPTSITFVSGALFAAYLLGVAISSILIGILYEFPISLGVIYWLLSIPILIIGFLCYISTKTKN